MNTIYKYQLDLIESQFISVHQQNRALSVGEQNGRICLWALVDTKSVSVSAEIKIFGTGHDVTALDLDFFKFLGTVQMENGLVFHVFIQV